MQISALAERTGVSVATLKYYLREGLLMPGVATSATRATYAAEHVERVRLVRALIQTGGLSVAAVREVVGALASTPPSVTELLGTAHEALPAPGADHAEDRVVADLLDALAWRVHADSVARHTLSAALEAASAAGVSVTAEHLSRYAEAVETIAEVDLDVAAAEPDLSHMLHTVVVGTVMLDPVLSALRRLAQQHVTTGRLG